MDSENTNFSFRILDDLSTAVIRIRSFVKHENDDFSGFLKSSFNQINSRNIQNLIVDVRGNDGGHPEYSINVLRYLMDKDFVYFKTKVSDEEWNNPIKPYGEIKFILVLITHFGLAEKMLTEKFF